MDRREIVILASILTLATALRLAWLNMAPPSLNWDEVSHGYNAYSILKTGADEYGNKFPVLLRSFDDYKASLYAYLTIPFIFVFGLNEYAVRAVSVLAGLVTVFSVYLIANELMGNKRVAAIAALLTSVSPWSIMFSRAAFEANLANALLLLGTYFILASKFKDRRLIVGGALLGLSAHAYIANRLISPLIAIVLALHFLENIRPRIHLSLKALAVAVLIASPVVMVQIFNPETAFRFGSTSLSARLSGASELTPARFLGEMTARYMSYFSPANLFVRGSPEPTQRLEGFGVFYNVEFVFWIAGLAVLVKRFKQHRALVYLLAASPLVASITWNWFYPARVLALFSFFAIVTALGIDTLLKATKPRFRLLWLLPSALFLVQIGNLFTTVFLYMPYHHSGAWQFGMKELAQAATARETNYEKIVIETPTAQPHIFFLFYGAYPPAKYQTETSELSSNSKPRTGYDFGKYEFRPVYWLDHDEELKNTLLIAPESSLVQDKVVQNPNLKEFFLITDRFGNIIAHGVGLY